MTELFFHNGTAHMPSLLKLCKNLHFTDVIFVVLNVLKKEWIWWKEVTHVLALD